MNLAELRYGIEIVADPALRRDLSDWLSFDIRPMFENRVLPLTEDIVVKWRLLAEVGRKQRQNFSPADLFIAATALQYDLVVVSRDERVFEAVGAPLLNPWK
jgi:predicted nucleic acid-binding protein